MRIRQHSTGFNKKGLKWKRGGLEESSGTARTEKPIVLSSPGAYGDWQGTCCFPELNIQGSPENTQGWDTPPASGPQPSRNHPAHAGDSKTWAEGVGRALRRDLERQFPLCEQPKTALSPLNHISCFLAPTKDFCGVPLLVTFTLWPLSQIMVHFIRLVWDQDQWLCTLLTALILLPQIPILAAQNNTLLLVAK